MYARLAEYNWGNEDKNNFRYQCEVCGWELAKIWFLNLIVIYNWVTPLSCALKTSRNKILLLPRQTVKNIHGQVFWSSARWWTLSNNQKKCISSTIRYAKWYSGFSHYPNLSEVNLLLQMEGAWVHKQWAARLNSPAQHFVWSSRDAHAAGGNASTSCSVTLKVFSNACIQKLRGTLLQEIQLSKSLLGHVQLHY